MKKLLIFLMILTLVCLAVSCGKDQTPAKTTAESTADMRPLPPETEGTTQPSAVTTTAPTQNGTNDTTKAPNATEVPGTTETPVSTKTPDTAKTPETTKPWIGMIPIL